MARATQTGFLGGQGAMLLVLVVVVIGGFFLFQTVTTQQSAVTIRETVAQVSAQRASVPVQSLVASTRNIETFALESSGDIELWVTGSDISDPQDIGELDEITLSSGTATSTSSTEYKSDDTQNSRDLYYEGGSTHYDEKINSWSISYNIETDKGVLQVNDRDYIEITDLGTWENMDTADTLGTSFADSGTDTWTYNKTDGTGTSAIKWVIGNTESDSVIRQPVICIGDAEF